MGADTDAALAVVPGTQANAPLAPQCPGAYTPPTPSRTRPSFFSVPSRTGLVDDDTVVDPQWQWRHTKEWRNYDAAANVRIERAYQLGDSKIRVKTGKDGTTPMTIFFVDMKQFDPITLGTRDVRRVGPNGAGLLHRVKRSTKEVVRAWETGHPRRELFTDFLDRRNKLHENSQIADDESDTLPLKTGFFARVVGSRVFFMITMVAVVANAAWLAVDADMNDSDLLVDAPPHFQVVEHTFCAFFSLELLLRAGAFARWRNALSDYWFLFDLALVVLMVMETWVLPLIFVISDADSAVTAGLSEFSLFRLLRLLRISRLTRLLRAIPEVVTLLKGIATAVRSVVCTVLLLMVVVYVFSVVFRTQALANEFLEHMYFSSVSHSMSTLLLHGVLLDSVSKVVRDMYTDGWFTACLFMCFVFITTFSVLNMLIGILCEVVSLVSRREREAAEVAFLRANLLDLLEAHDINMDRTVGKDEFKLMLDNPDVHEILARFGTDVNGLRSIADILFDGRADDINREINRELLASASQESLLMVSMESLLSSGGNDDVLTANVLAAAHDFKDSPTSVAYGATAAPQRGNIASSCFVGGAGDGRRARRAQLSFVEVLEVVMRLRGSNAARVNDIVELRKYTKKLFDDAHKLMSFVERQERCMERAAAGVGKRRCMPRRSMSSSSCSARSMPLSSLSEETATPKDEQPASARRANAGDFDFGGVAGESSRGGPEPLLLPGQQSELETQLEKLRQAQSVLSEQVGRVHKAATTRQRVVTVRLNMPEKRLLRRHCASSTLAQVFQQVVPSLGFATVRDAAGIELGWELQLGSLANGESIVELHIVSG